MKKIAIILLAFILISITGMSQKKAPVIIGLEVGNKAPEINLADTSGKIVALSSLKGKMVLIDFWASWCGPCRYENPSVVAAYNKFKDLKYKNAKGFTVYSVSLDQQKSLWIKAIAKDKLAWPSHVSDLKGWFSEAAKLYNVTGIPASFLINAKGIIIAKNLRGPLLDQELSKYVK